jgi:mono/diheme cytochrome c family protein
MRMPWTVLVVVALAAALVVVTRGAGLSARRSPLPGEPRLARAARAWLLPGPYRTMANPLEPTAAAVRAGMEHWADHCAVCHGNDGRGDVTIGRNLFPPAPDMQAAPTQGLPDGALFHAIEEGIPFTGMPAWSTGTAEGERQSWELVLFIRHLPRLTAAELREMEALNPKSQMDLEREREIEDFLGGV